MTQKFFIIGNSNNWIASYLAMTKINIILSPEVKILFRVCFLFMLQLIHPDISHRQEWRRIISEWDNSRKRPRIFFQENFEDFLEKVRMIEKEDNEGEQIAKSSIFFLQRTEDKRLIG